jgi:putative nucleotidyltransferase with HDIG domain
MPDEPQDHLDAPLVFAQEETDLQGRETLQADIPKSWTVLIVDDEEDVHKITRITLKGFSFQGRGIRLLSAYSGDDVKTILAKEKDVALVLLDVVMEEEDTGLKLVEYIRNDLENSSIRIVLRTGQPGKAPEQTVISRYDINDYKTKPEFTAQKLFTCVTACLRAYENLKAIERNRAGLESIINSAAIVFENPSFAKFGHRILEQLHVILNLDRNADTDSAYFMGLPAGQILLMAGTGAYGDREGTPLEEVVPESVLKEYEQLASTGGEVFLTDQYLGVFKFKRGFLNLLYLKTSVPLGGVEKYLLRIYAHNISIGFDNIRLAREIINTQKEVILTLGEVVETRSQETAHHVTRVAEVCYCLARQLGLDERTAELLRLGSPMHDVGKIGVPEAILNKPGKLTADEFEIIKAHARTGYEILKKSNRSIMTTAAIVAHQHHERWDGKGYPQGLKGKNIHVFGRIAAIADVFDALSHKRCYKEAWSLEKIVDLFKREAGHQFDPELVVIFLANIKEFVGVNRRFPQ